MTDRPRRVDRANSLPRSVSTLLPSTVTSLLDLARDAAHGVARPAAPLTTFLVGLAAGQRGATAEAVRDAAEIARRLATERGEP